MSGYGTPLSSLGILGYLQARNELCRYVDMLFEYDDLWQFDVVKPIKSHYWILVYKHLAHIPGMNEFKVSSL